MVKKFIIPHSKKFGRGDDFRFDFQIQPCHQRSRLVFHLSALAFSSKGCFYSLVKMFKQLQISCLYTISPQHVFSCISLVKIYRHMLISYQLLKEMTVIGFMNKILPSGAGRITSTLIFQDGYLITVQNINKESMEK